MFFQPVLLAVIISQSIVLYLGEDNNFGLIRILALSNLFCHLFFALNNRMGISILHRAFILLLTLPPFLHLLVEVLSGTPPRYVYPISTQAGGQQVEAIAYLYVCLFLNIFLLVALRQKAKAIVLNKGPGYRNFVAFSLLLSLAFIFGALSTSGDSLAFMTGGYATGEGSAAGINAWNAMAIICFILSLAFLDFTSLGQRIYAVLGAIWVVGLCSLLYGKRADASGVFVALFFFFISKGNFKSNLKSGLLIFISIIIIIISGAARTDGIERATFGLGSFLMMEPNSFSLPSLTDFFSTMPYVVSYIEFDHGETWGGTSYVNAASTLLPTIINPFRIEESATTFLQENYFQFNGGMYFPAELYFNFGMFGALIVIALISIMLSGVVKIIANTPSKLPQIIPYAILAGYPRWLYYGTSAFTKHLFLVFLFIMLIYLLIRPGRNSTQGRSHFR